MINGLPFSTPDVEAAQYLNSPSKGSLDVALAFYNHPNDFASLHLKMLGRDIDLDNDDAGHILIWAKDIRELGPNLYPDSLEVLRRFCPQMNKAAVNVMSLTITADPIQFALPFGILTQLESKSVS